MEIAEALAADELWGWPVEVLGQLVQLRARAYRGEITLDEWRDQDAALRVGRPPVDSGAVAAFHDRTVRSGGAGSIGLLVRLGPLLGSEATDERLWRELAATDGYLRRPRPDPEMEEMMRSTRAVIVGWLTGPDSGRDPVSGLPWALIDQFRVVDLPDLGPVPQHLDTARRLARAAADPEERRRADLLSEPDSVQRRAELTADLRNDVITGFPRLVVEAARTEPSLEPVADAVRAIWRDPQVQQLLLAETSNGWAAARSTVTVLPDRSSPTR